MRLSTACQHALCHPGASLHHVAASLVFVAVFALAACGSSPSPTNTDDDRGVAGPSEVSLEPVSSRGANPFTPPVGKDRKKIKPPKAAVSAGPATYAGNLPGLYGGTRNTATCDSDRLVDYLEATPAKATAWAGAIGIRTTEIRNYVSRLTAVVLRTDTRVTNHGFVGGVANPIPALLQAGTAVLVDRYGLPRVKCYCGNPLTEALQLTQPRYVGTPWDGFEPGHITIINSSTTIIQNFRIYDPLSNSLFRRPVGTDGVDDGPFLNQAPPSTTTTPPPAPPPPPAATQPPPPPPPPPTAPSENPAASFSPVAGHRGDQYTLSASGYAPNTTLSVELTRPDGVLEHYSINTDSSGSGSFQFQPTGSATPLGTYTAVVRNPATGAQTQASTSVS